jgi:uncharacterized protein with PIN domain
MKCPECNEELEVHLNEHRLIAADFEELEFSCPKCERNFFARIHQEDLLESA